jgi:3,4-dihydroxy 2-butanone 4-phosphate synthase/GTP cyclohydrolase II|tara:strand:+ start:331 stop:1530 length:1200 start_codon:yes stop_codon:yes gene_type:complete
MNIKKIKSAIEDIQNGKFVIVTDDADRENEGDLIMASEMITPEAVNFMAKYARGLICISITKNDANRLSLDLMEQKNTSLHETNFTVSVDAVANTTTGISAQDRAQTIRLMVDENSSPSDFARPGHIFPIIAKDGGVLRRSGHTEASMDLAQLAGFKPSGVLCEIMAEDGSMLRGKALSSFAKNHNLNLISISELIAYIRINKNLVEKVEAVRFPTEYGEFLLHLYQDKFEDKQHIALTYGKLSTNEPVLIRVHSECVTGDIFSSSRCDCGKQLEYAMKTIVENGSGVIVYLKQEGRGIGLKHKIKAYKLQDEGLDTVEANQELGFPPDMRDYGTGAQILKDLKISKLRVMTNNPKKLVGLEGHGLKIEERVKINVSLNKENEKYLKTKAKKLGHIIEL